MEGRICYNQQRKICQKTLLLDVPGGYRYNDSFPDDRNRGTQDRLYRSTGRDHDGRFVDQIADCLRADEKVTIAGFGRSEMRPRKPKAYTNPKTKVSSRLESTSIPGFKASGRFKQKLEAGRAAAQSVEETA